MSLLVCSNQPVHFNWLVWSGSCDESCVKRNRTNRLCNDTIPVLPVHMELNRESVTNGKPEPFVTSLTD